MVATSKSRRFSPHSQETLPGYAPELAAFHRAFAAELKAVVQTLPLSANMHVLDVGCGDGFYLGLLAKRLQSPGSAVGFDINPACIELARRRVERLKLKCDVKFLQGDLSSLQKQHGRWDFIWCAQSLHTLPDSVSTLRQMKALLRPGGMIAVLENDTVHQLSLPWPPRLEIALRAAELAALSASNSQPAKYYVGRHLPAVFDAVGLEPLAFRTQCIDRQAPIDGDLELFLRGYFDRLLNRVRPYLQRELLEDFSELIDPGHARYLLRQRYFTLSWLNVLVWGRGRRVITRKRRIRPKKSG